MHRTFIFTFATSLALCAVIGYATELPERSLHGVWIGDLRNGCGERMKFSPDGRIHVESGAEVLDGRYTVSEAEGAPQP